MGIFDALDGSAYTRANRNNQYAVATGLQQGGNALQSGAQASLGYLLGGNGSPGALQVTDRGYDQAGQALGHGYAGTQSALSALGNLYQPMTQQGQGAFTLYNDAIGANGTDGQSRARQAFQSDPGYQYSMDQALGSVQRTAAARGGLAGGNATQDILRTATGLADQSYDKFVNRLAGGASAYGAGISGQAGALGAQASAAQQYGSGLAGLDTGRGAALSGILGSAGGVQQQLGQNTASLVNNATNTLAQGNLYAAKGQTDASNNALGALFGAASLAAGGLGGSGGLGSLGNVFMGGAKANSPIGKLGSGLADLAGYSPIPRF